MYRITLDMNCIDVEGFAKSNNPSGLRSWSRNNSNMDLMIFRFSVTSVSIDLGNLIKVVRNSYLLLREKDEKRV